MNRQVAVKRDSSRRNRYRPLKTTRIVPPNPDGKCARSAPDLRLFGTGENSRFEQRAFGTGLTKQVVAQSQLRAVRCCDFHQAVGHVHGVARRRNVLIAAAAKAGCNDGAEMRADLEAGLRRDRWRKRFDPSLGAVAKVDAA